MKIWGTTEGWKMKYTSLFGFVSFTKKFCFFHRFKIVGAKSSNRFHVLVFCFFFCARTTTQRELGVSERAWHLYREIETGRRRARPETVAESISVRVKHVCVERRMGNKNSEHPPHPTPVTDNRPCYNIVLIPGRPFANTRRVVRHDRMRRETYVYRGPLLTSDCFHLYCGYSSFAAYFRLFAIDGNNVRKGTNAAVAFPTWPAHRMRSSVHRNERWKDGERDYYWK